MRIKQIYLRDRSCAWLQKIDWAGNSLIHDTQVEFDHSFTDHEFRPSVSSLLHVNNMQMGGITRLLFSQGEHTGFKLQGQVTKLWSDHVHKACNGRVALFCANCVTKRFRFRHVNSLVQAFYCKELRFQMTDVLQACQSHIIIVEAFEFRFLFF